MSRISAKQRVDDLISWYEQFNPDAGKQVSVRVTSSTVRKFARKSGGAFMYRDREIVPMRKTRKELEQTSL